MMTSFGAVSLSFLVLATPSCSAIECNFYLAESTIPNAGVGIFSAIELNPGDAVAEPDVCIPVFDLYSHHDDPFDPFFDYVWTGDAMGMELELESEDIEALCPGIDSAVNCNLALINVGKATPIYDNAGLHRAKNPGAGAMTPYHNGTTRTIRRVPVGGELFKVQKEATVFTTRPFFDSFPISDDFDRAQRLLERFFKIAVSVQRISYEDAIIPIQSIWNTRTLNALPKSFEEALVAREHDIGMTHQPNATRTIKWLAENGKCVDNIFPGKSTIEGAGHGAFTKRDLPKGTIVTGSPLHHLPLKENYMPMYRLFHENADTETQVKNDVIGYQLVMNYCFGHSESSLMLFPYGIGVNYINHNQTLANVRVEWARDGVTTHDASWFSRTPNEMLSTKVPHLALDYIATRDIVEGEELFLDYGDEWEDAWQRHAAKMKTENIWSSTYSDARSWNEAMGSKPIRTAAEVSSDPYPQNLQVRCHIDLAEGHWGQIFEWSILDYGYPCEVLDRFQDDLGRQTYSIRFKTDNEFESPEVLTINGVPRGAIRFFDAPSTSDLHLQGAFRHHIGLPEDMVPDVWRNRKGNLTI
eukprot:scaffold818_cov136-Cylindrotheca_fusiformis.AAC.36